jgi:hypothetical protein
MTPSEQLRFGKARQQVKDSLKIQNKIYFAADLSSRIASRTL